jgi:hypothetical protein
MDMTNETNRKAPPKGLMKVLSLFGLFILVAFPVGMLFAGFSTLEVSCTRNQAGQLPDCEIREERLFGLFQRRAIVTGVTGVGYNTRNISTGSRAILGSTVVLSGSNGSFPVSRATSNVGSDWKSDLIVKVERFLNSPNEQTLALHINERNLFGWIGAACVAFIAYCYVSWFVRKLTGRP